MMGVEATAIVGSVVKTGVLGKECKQKGLRSAVFNLQPAITPHGEYYTSRKLLETKIEVGFA